LDRGAGDHDRERNMNEAVAGLLGVLLGGLLTGTIEAVRERRRERVASGVAIRLVHAELVRAGSAVGLLARGEASWRDVKTSVLNDVTWTEYRATLAQSLATPDWQAVAKTYISIAELHGMAALHGEQGFDDPDRHFLGTLESGIHSSARQLGALVYGTWGTTDTRATGPLRRLASRVRGLRRSHRRL
jgi:hypothetical protein